MVTRARKGAGEPVEAVDARAVLARYRRWLGRQPLASRTRQVYLAQVTAYVQWLAGGEHGGAALREPAVRDWAVRDYKRHLSRTRKLKPASVNQALAAIDNFCRQLGLGRPEVKREKLPRVAPRALDADEQRRFLRAVERAPSARNRAIATVFFYTGLRLSELAALDVDDVAVSARRGRLTVRSGKGDLGREVPLNSACRSVLDTWTKARAGQLAGLRSDEPRPALWLSRTGNRMSPRAIDLVIRGLADDAGLAVSAHVLRHTWVTNLVRSGADVVLVAEIAGHARLDTTRRYSLPSDADRDAAVEAVLVQT